MLIPGTVLAQRYKIQHLIAEGGLAEIYLAHNDDSEKNEPHLIAIKRLKPVFSHDCDLARWFKEEASIISSLRHPFLVQGFGLIEENSELLLPMEYVRGRTLSDLRSSIVLYPVALRTRFVIALGTALCEALSHLHREKDEEGTWRSLIHGDVSPQNIMVCFDGRIKLVDFGNAMAINSPRASQSRLVCVNERYMAPEQKRGAKIGQACDIYGLSVVLLEVWGTKVPWGKFQKKLNTILHKAAHLDANQRYQNCASLQKDLQTLSAAMQLNDTSALLKMITKRRSKKKIFNPGAKLWGLRLITVFMLIGIFVISVLQILTA